MPMLSDSILQLLKWCDNWFNHFIFELLQIFQGLEVNDKNCIEFHPQRVQTYSGFQHFAKLPITSFRMSFKFTFSILFEC